jgi:methionine synthase I (cobalamin-dependent)
LALTPPTSGGRSVGILSLRNKTIKLSFSDGKDNKMSRVVTDSNSGLPNLLKKKILYKRQISYAKQRPQHFYSTANLNNLM